MPFQLVHQDSGSSVALAPNTPISLGRAPTNDFVTDKKVSRKAVSIVHTASGTVEVRCTGINEVLVRKADAADLSVSKDDAAELRAGDVLCLRPDGSWPLVLKWQEDEEEEEDSQKDGEQDARHSGGGGAPSGHAQQTPAPAAASLVTASPPAAGGTKSIVKPSPPTAAAGRSSPPAAAGRSSSNPDPAASASASAAAAAAASGGSAKGSRSSPPDQQPCAVVWECFMKEQLGTWRPYSVTVSAEIEAAAAAGPDCGDQGAGWSSFVVDTGYGEYRVDLTSATEGHQINPKTKWSRPIRRNEKAASVKPSSLPSAGDAKKKKAKLSPPPPPAAAAAASAAASAAGTGRGGKNSKAAPRWDDPMDDDDGSDIEFVGHKDADDDDDRDFIDNDDDDFDFDSVLRKGGGGGGGRGGGVKKPPSTGGTAAAAVTGGKRKMPSSFNPDAQGAGDNGGDGSKKPAAAAKGGKAAKAKADPKEKKPKKAPAIKPGDKKDPAPFLDNSCPETGFNIAAGAKFKELHKACIDNGQDPTKCATWPKVAKLLLRAFPHEVTAGSELLIWKGMGDGSAKMLNEFLETGHLARIDTMNDSNDDTKIAAAVFEQVRFFNRKHAGDVAAAGISNFRDFSGRCNEFSWLTGNHQASIKYHESTSIPTPLDEAHKLLTAVQAAVDKASGGGGGGGGRNMACASLDYRLEKPTVNDTLVVVAKHAAGGGAGAGGADSPAQHLPFLQSVADHLRAAGVLKHCFECLDSRKLQMVCKLSPPPPPAAAAAAGATGAAATPALPPPALSPADVPKPKKKFLIPTSAAVKQASSDSIKAANTSSAGAFAADKDKSAAAAAANTAAAQSPAAPTGAAPSGAGGAGSAAHASSTGHAPKYNYVEIIATEPDLFGAVMLFKTGPKSYIDDVLMTGDVKAEWKLSDRGLCHKPPGQKTFKQKSEVVPTEEDVYSAMNINFTAVEQRGYKGKKK